MAATFNPAVITEGGMALLTKAQAGQCKIEFTRMAIGNGEYTEAEKASDALKVMTGLKSLKNSYSPGGIVIYNDTTVRISARLTNYDTSTKTSLVDESYYINEIGLFAKEKDGADSTEVLYSIAVTAGEQGDVMPAYTGDNPTQVVQEYYATVDNSLEVTIEVIDDAYALEEDVEAQFKVVYDELAECVKTADIADNLTTESAEVPLSANQGVVLSGLIEQANTLIAQLQSAVTAAEGNISSLESDKAPVNHASTATTYGQGNASNFGHVKLSDKYTSSDGAASAGVGASDKALYDAYTELNGNLQNLDKIQLVQATSFSEDDIFDYVDNEMSYPQACIVYSGSRAIPWTYAYYLCVQGSQNHAWVLANIDSRNALYFARRSNGLGSWYNWRCITNSELDTSVGSESTPIYLNNGVPTACGFKVQYGSAIVDCTANTVSTYDVTFSSAFSSTPRILLTANSSTPGTQLMECSFNNVSETGFTICVYRTNTNSTAVNWLAIGA